MSSMVSNEIANELLIAVKKGERIKEFMDAVINVKGYKIEDINNQGVIKRAFSKELSSDQFLTDINDVISEFWTTVFMAVPIAKLHGEKVLINKPGQEKEIRETKNNPINFLRNKGILNVRNFITKCYKKNLRQYCPECGHSTVVKSDKTCSKCGNEKMSAAYNFSELEYKASDNKGYEYVEQMSAQDNINRILDDFANTVLKPNTRAYQILKILTDPSKSTEMCKACNLCGADSFDIDSCTNYNANIGRWIGVNKTMIANKVRSIRTRLTQYLISLNSHESRDLLSMIPDNFKH